MPKFAFNKSSVKRIDHGLKRIQNVLKSIEHDKSYVKIGVLGAEAAKPREDAGTGGGEWSPMTNAKLATIHEFGTRDGHIPERSFIRSTMNANRARYLDLLRQMVKASVYEGKITYARALEIIGMKIVADMKAKITAGIPPPNAPSTLAAKLEKTRKGSKGSPVPLIDTGALRNSITHEVVLANSAGPIPEESEK